MYRTFGLLFAIPFEAVIFFILSIKVGEYLNEHHPYGFDWKAALLILSFFAVSHTFYKAIKLIIDEQKKAD